MRNSLSRLMSQTKQRLTRIAAIVLVMVAAFWIYANLRGYQPNSHPPTLADLTAFEFHQYDTGLFLQVLIAPVGLIYLLTAIPFFRQVLQDQTVPHVTLGIFASLAVVQVLSQSYDIWTYHRMLGQPQFAIGP